VCGSRTPMLLLLLLFIPMPGTNAEASPIVRFTLIAFFMHGCLPSPVNAG